MYVFLPSILVISCYELVFGTLYPAYASYKAVRTKNVKEYVKWMMYWIVFALFTFVETLFDIVVSFWLPFYYEMKILFVLWLLSPATKGSSILYRKFVHPQFMKREKEIDECLATARDRGYASLVHLSSRGLSYATAVIMQTAMRGQMSIVNHIRKSYSMTALDKEYPPQVSEAQLDGVDRRLESSSLQHRWHSDATIPENEDQSMNFQETTISRSRSKSHQGSTSETYEGSNLRRTRSESKAPRKVRVAIHPTTQATSHTASVSHTDINAYATFPRSRTRTTKKKQTKQL
ncbi:receptor expression-enhancing protein 1-like isoform X1 [Tachypleus tridentatus]|uniref:receptor expression-enhancing protein 1-like isoform X1 n=1 Tax=Tachypleus tridentatus TaxID=6853 RepID=UPI003FCF6250